MRVLLLAYALLRTAPTPAAQSNAPAPAQKLARITESLKKVQSGLSALPNPPSGLSGLMSEIDSTLVKLASTAVSDAEKMVSASSVMHAIGEFKDLLTQRQNQLEAEGKVAAAFKARTESGEGDKEEELFKALLVVQDVPMPEQLKVLHDAKFANLTIVPKVEKSTMGDTLAVRMGMILDGRDVEERKALGPKAVSKTEKLATIARALQARETRIEEELKAADAKEAAREKEVASSVKLQSQMGAAATKEMGQGLQALKFVDREAKHAFLKKEVAMKKEAAALKAAVSAIHANDVAKIQASLDSLKTLGPEPQPLA